MFILKKIITKNGFFFSVYAFRVSNYGRFGWFCFRNDIIQYNIYTNEYKSLSSLVLLM